MEQAPQLDIDYVAKLARIALTAEEKAEYASQLANILSHIRQLEKVDVSAVEPTAHAFPVENIWSDDAARPGLTAEDALRNAPAQRENMIVVPKVIE
jgi:aspartyl-tRNA(Asn)/glutamyl-tRNA(Gln) amidotransferase subunit C